MTDTARDALERWIACQLPQFSYSELKTIAVRVERLAKAIADYGNLDLATDRRIWKLERAYEGVDEKWYEDAETVFDHDPAFADIREMRKRERLQRFIDCATDTDADFEDEKPTNQFRLGVSNNSSTESALCQSGETRDAQTAVVVPRQTRPDIKGASAGSSPASDTSAAPASQPTSATTLLDGTNPGLSEAGAATYSPVEWRGAPGGLIDCDGDGYCKRCGTLLCGGCPDSEVA